MRRALPTLTACVALFVLAGCGSSGSSTTTSTGGSAATDTTSSGAVHTAPGNTVHFTNKPKFVSPSSTQAIGGGHVHVIYRNISIHPDTLRVKAGTVVTWTNLDSVEHNVTSESGPQKFASRTFGEGHSFSVKLTTPGTIHYECTIHPVSMNGTIEVVK